MTRRELLITGGTGSLGKAILKILSELEYNYFTGIRIYSRDEFKQHNLRQKLKEFETPTAYIIGDIRDHRRLEEALRGVTHVIHTAALKHVPIAEENPLEYIQTNILGTENVMRAAINAGVLKAIFISTDKAAEPTTLYGASKMAAEKLWLRGSIYGGGKKTKFAAVRYGNVIGSRGSIADMVDRFWRGKKIPITNPNMTRFWIQLPIVAQFILDRLHDMQDGVLYVPKMLSCSLRTFMKATTNTEDESWEIIGKRPGEKLHEMLITQDEVFRASEKEKHYEIYQREAELWEKPLYDCLYSDRRNPLFTNDVEKIKELLCIENLEPL